MTQVITNHEPLHHHRAYLHWEMNPHHSRERLTIAKDAKAGDLIIFATEYQGSPEAQYEPFTGVGIAPNPNQPTDREGRPYQLIAEDGYTPQYVGTPKIALLLEDCQAGQSALCVTKFATLILEHINNLSAEVWAADVGARLREEARNQNLVVEHEAKVLVDTSKEWVRRD